MCIDKEIALPSANCFCEITSRYNQCRSHELKRVCGSAAYMHGIYRLSVKLRPVTVKAYVSLGALADGWACSYSMNGAVVGPNFRAYQAVVYNA